MINSRHVLTTYGLSGVAFGLRRLAKKRGIRLGVNDEERAHKYWFPRLAILKVRMALRLRSALMIRARGSPVKEGAWPKRRTVAAQWLWYSRICQLS